MLIVVLLSCFQDSEYMYDHFKNVCLNGTQFANMMEWGVARTRARAPKFNAVQWHELRCKELVFSKTFKLKVRCLKGNGGNVFVGFINGSRKLRNLRDYMEHVQSGYITKRDHVQLFDYLAKRGPMLNHNTDVSVLHFKPVIKGL